MTKAEFQPVEPTRPVPSRLRVETASVRSESQGLRVYNTRDRGGQCAPRWTLCALSSSWPRARLCAPRAQETDLPTPYSLVAIPTGRASPSKSSNWFPRDHRHSPVVRATVSVNPRSQPSLISVEGGQTTDNDEHVERWTMYCVLGTQVDCVGRRRRHVVVWQVTEVRLGRSTPPTTGGVSA